MNIPNIKSLRQLHFCSHYAETGNGTQSARQAGYTESASHVAATRLLKQPHIQEQIAIFREKYTRERGIDTNDLIDQLTAVATAPSLATFLTKTESGEVIWKDPSELSERQRDSLKATIPVKDVLGDWSRYEQHDKATAVASLTTMLNPQLSDCQREIIVTALTRIGKQRGFSEFETELLTGLLKSNRQNHLCEHNTDIDKLSII